MTRAAPETSVASLLERRVRETPDKPAYVYLGDPAGPLTWSYRDLQARAWAVAAALQARGAAGARVLLLYPPGLDFIAAFLGCMASGAVAVPAPPPNPLKPERSLLRLTAIVDSARPEVALTTGAVLEAIRPAVADLPTFARLDWLATDGLAPHAEAPAGLAPGSGADVAFLQYTSGSTSDPKGAALTHESLLHNVAYFDEGWDHDPDSVLVSWLPSFHDLGLVYGILTPLWGGFTGVQMSPIDVIMRPLVWLQAITAHRATHSAGPNFIYELCVRKVRDADLEDLDLSSWRMALNAAEPVRAETLARFVERFEPVGFRPSTFSPGYGLSEGTCKVAALPWQEAATVLHLRDDALEAHRVEPAEPGPGVRAVVGCGRPTFGVEIAIVDPETRRPKGEDAVGEIWVCGPSIASAYWEQPEATRTELKAVRADGHAGPWLRTGDLGFLHDGQLFVTGRIKDLIIVRGSNHYPQDLEYTAQDASPAIRPGCVAAFSYEADGEERVALVAEVEPNRGGAAADLVARVRRAISEAHGLKVHRVELIRAGTIPKTTSGKIQRQACKHLLLGDRLEQVAA